MPPRLVLILAVAVGLIALGLLVTSFAGTKKTEAPKGAPAVNHTLYDFEVKTIEGKPVKLDAYKGKTVLVVNTASKCGLTPQYEGLEKLYDTYKDRDFVILGFPANNFMGQEPGTNEEIQQFCKLKYDVEFPMFSKISVKGKDIDPLYTWLTTGAGFDGDIEWNFAKFLVGPDGKVVARFHPKKTPLDPEVVAKIEAALPAKKGSS
jgi:glutathione peroxidase